MSNGTASAISGLATVLAGLTPQQLGFLGNHLSQSNEMRALQIIMSMQTNPGLAPALLPSLGAIPNLPPQVMTWVTSALGSPAAFGPDLAQATAALQTAATSSGILGGIL